MKISASAVNDYTKAAAKSVLPLVPEKEEEVSSDRMVTHTLYSDPENPDDSPKYKVTVRILQGDEDARALIKWRKAVNRVLSGLGIDTQPAAVPIVETMMTGTPQALFNEGIEAAMRARRAARAAAAANANARNAILNQEHRS